MRNKIILCLLLFSTASVVHADTKNISVNLATTIKESIDTLDIRTHQRLGKTTLHYSIVFLWDSMLPKDITGAMLGLGFQFPRNRKEPFFYGLSGYLLFENSVCDSGNKSQQEICVDNKMTGIFNGRGNQAIIQPEIGLRFEIKRNLWLSSSLRYWWSNEESLNDHLGVSVGIQF